MFTAPTLPNPRARHAAIAALGSTVLVVSLQVGRGQLRSSRPNRAGMWGVVLAGWSRRSLWWITHSSRGSRWWAWCARAPPGFGLGLAYHVSQVGTDDRMSELVRQSRPIAWSDRTSGHRLSVLGKTGPRTAIMALGVCAVTLVGCSSSQITTAAAPTPVSSTVYQDKLCSANIAVAAAMDRFATAASGFWLAV